MSSYATLADLTTYGCSAKALRDITPQEQQSALDTAASRLDGYLGSRFVLPLVVWGLDIRRHCAVIASFDLLMGRGLDPDSEQAKTLAVRFDAEQKWLNQIARQEVVPVVTDSSVISSTDRGGGGAFAVQTQVQGGTTPEGINVGGPPPSIKEGNSGNVITGSPSLRGW